MSQIHWYTEEELKLVLRQLPSDLHRLLVLVTLYHGLRNSESLKMTGDSIAGRHISVKRLKGSRPCNQTWKEHSDQELNETLLLEQVRVCRYCECSKLNQTPCITNKEHDWRELRSNERIFTMFNAKPDANQKCKSVQGRFGYYRMMNRAAAKAGIAKHKRKVHILKHTCGMIAAKKGARYAQAILGHESLDSTGPYVEISAQRADKAFAKLVLSMGEILDEEE